MEQKVTTHNRRFVHLSREDGNTKCGALPKYYGAGHLIVISDEEAEEMHHCKRCFPRV